MTSTVMAAVLHTISDFDFVLVNTQKDLTSVQLKVPSHKIISSPKVVTMVVKISEIKMAKKNKKTYI